MRRTWNSRLFLWSFTVGVAMPLAAAAEGHGPCEQVVAACKSAGFVAGDAREGYGLWKDCVDPIMRGTPQPPKANKPLPAVPPETVAACKARRPNFGEGKRGAYPPPPPPVNP
jgi:hypothetical protein